MLLAFRDDEKYQQLLATGLKEEDADAASSGWRQAMRIEAGFFLACATVASIMLQRPPRKKIEARQETQSSGSIWDAVRSRPMLTQMTFMFIGSFGYSNPFVHIDASARDAGLDSSNAAFALSILGIGSMFGRVIMGIVADAAPSRVAVLQISIYVMTFATIAWPYCETPASFFVYAFIYGFNAGAFVSLPPTIIADYMAHRKDILATLVGFNFSSASPGVMLGGPIVGWLYDASGPPQNYVAGGYFTFGALFIGTTALFAMPKLKGIAEPNRAAVIPVELAQV